MKIDFLFSRPTAFVCISLLFISVGCQQKKKEYPGNGPVPPGNTIETFETQPGFQIELIASEPLISDPVDMEIDEYGRMYVVEMHGYPLDKSGSGKIRMLTDSNGDGKLDKSTIFADHLVLPNSVMRWKKGVLVTDAPNVLYFEDTNGDGVADIRDTVLTGFSLSNPHINVNNPLYGLDNYIHLAHRGAITTRNYEDIFGDKGTEIYFPDQPDSPRLPKNADNHCVRFRPDEHLLEMTSGNAPVYNGRAYIDYLFRMQGTPFFNDKPLSKGWLTYNGEKYDPLNILYDLTRNEVVILLPDSNSRAVLNNEFIDSFQLADHTFLNLKEGHTQNLAVAGFYDLLHNGKVLLLARRTKIISEIFSENQVVRVMTPKDYFYIHKGGLYYLVSDKKDVLRVLSDRKSDIKKMMRSRRIKLNRKNFENALISVVTFYDHQTR